MIERLFPNAQATVERYRRQLFTRLFGTAEVEQSVALPQVPRSWLGRHGRVLIAAVAALFYGLFLVYAARSWDLSTLRSIQVDPRGIALATGVQIAGYLIVIRMRQLLLGWLGAPLPFHQHQRVCAYSDLAAKLPGFFWFYVSRIYLYGRIGAPRTAVGVMIMLEIFAVGVAGSLIALAVSLFRPDLRLFLPPQVLLAALAVCVALTHPLLLRALLRRLPGQSTLQAAAEQLSWGRVWIAILMMTVVSTMGGVCLFAVVSAVVGFGQTSLVPMIQIWAVCLVWGVLLSWLPADFGLRHGPMLVMLSAHFPSTLVLVLLIVWQVWVNLIEVMWGAVAIALTLLIASPAGPSR